MLKTKNGLLQPAPVEDATSTLAKAPLARRLLASGKKTLKWFAIGLVATWLIKVAVPFSPVIVGTESIPRGLYLLDSRPQHYKPGDYVTFRFAPAQAELRERFNPSGKEIRHTKMIKGVAGNIVTASPEGALKVCRLSVNPGGALADQIPTLNDDSPGWHCESAGTPQPLDSQGRALTAWLPPGNAYLLRPGEVWIYGVHEKSLDSRYYGPLAEAALAGRSYPLMTW